MFKTRQYLATDWQLFVLIKKYWKRGPLSMKGQKTVFKLKSIAN
jgi:hypothetical protein